MKKQTNEKQQNLYFLLKTLCKETYFFFEKNYFIKITFFNKKIIKLKILFKKT